MRSVGHEFYGTKDTLPQQIREALRERADSAIVWSSPDPKEKIGKYICCSTIGIMAILPCFWPHLCLCAVPCLCVAQIGKQSMLATSIVLLENSVEIITVEHDACICPGCYKKSRSMRTIPLERVTDVITDKVDKGCLTVCLPDVSGIQILDGQMITTYRTDQNGRGHSSTRHAQPRLVGHVHAEELRTEILKARDKDRNAHAANTTVVVQQQQGSSGGSKKSVAERLAELESLRNSGIIEGDTYDQKKKQIIADL